MKTLLFTTEYPPQFGGVSNYYEELVRHWPDQDGLAVLDNSNGKLVDNKLSFFKWRPAFSALSHAVKEQGIKHIIVGQILPLGTVAWIKSKRLGCTYSVVLHGMDVPFALRSSRKRWLAKRILAGAERVICTNSYVAELAKPLLNDHSKIAIVNPGIGKVPAVDGFMTDSLSAKYSLSGKTIILSLSRLVKRKGMDMVIRTLPALFADDPKLIYVIAGTGPDEAYLKGLAAALPEEDQKRIIFTGQITDAEKWSWLSLCRLFIMPARDIDGDFEGFGIVYLEANLMGKPVIAGRSGGVPDAVVSDLNGLLVNPNDTNEIRQAIQTLTQDEAYAEKLGTQGRERAIRHFTWNDKAKSFHDYINK
ncbi:glycosyltransferase family 4 protein [Candidatus Falkowbacteria bacterium]|nr:glycosyltransferase family 4 protein [Candidatus Falkowbacteria bacterium]